MNEHEIKQVLFTCKSQDPSEPIDPKGLYCDNLDIIEFAEKIAASVKNEAVRKERLECIKFVRSLNHMVAGALEQKRGNVC